MTTFVVLLGGPLTTTPRLLRQTADARFLAADSGMRHAVHFNSPPELWLGDFDSSDDALRKRWPDVERRVYPADKAKTDGELAIDEALARGASRLVLAGALGGERTDHALLHLALAQKLHADGLPVLLTSGVEEAWPVNAGRYTFEFPSETLFSIVGFGPIGGLTVSGAKWPLENADVAAGSSLTLSNVTTGELAVTLGSGRAFVIACPANGFTRS